MKHNNDELLAILSSRLNETIVNFMNDNGLNKSAPEEAKNRIELIGQAIALNLGGILAQTFNKETPDDAIMDLLNIIIRKAKDCYNEFQCLKDHNNSIN